MSEGSAPAGLWSSGEAYERYIGRWSRPVAREFLAWLSAPRGARWLDVGCGTGALTETILADCAPRSVQALDPSDAFVGFARTNHGDARAQFTIGTADALPVRAQAFDAAVCGLVLTFVPDVPRAVGEIARVLNPRGIAGAYVWDYAEGMEIMRHFWDVAEALDPAVARIAESRNSAVCHPDALTRIWSNAGLAGVQTRAIDVATTFSSFDDYWRPFLGGRAPAPAYAMSLPEEQRARLRERLRARLHPDSDGMIRLTARAWAVKGVAP